MKLLHNLFMWTTVYTTILAAGLGGCTKSPMSVNVSQPCPCNDGITDNSIASKPCITKEIAILIAKAAALTNYDLKKLDSVVSDKGTAWVVEFKPKAEFRDWTGGDGSVRIDKETGEVVNFYFGK